MNSFGNGVVLPFLVIYLHDVRGFGLGVAGLVVAISAAAQLSAGVLAGPLDRPARRRVPSSAAGSCMQAVGIGLFPLVRAAVAGVRADRDRRSRQRRLLAEPVDADRTAHPAARRHAAFAQQRVTMNLGYRPRRPDRRRDRERLAARARSPSCSSSTRRRSSRTSAVLALIHDPGGAADGSRRAPTSYRAVLRDRLFLRLWTLNFLFVAAGYSLIQPRAAVRARPRADVSERQIGVVLLRQHRS